MCRRSFAKARFDQVYAGVTRTREAFMRLGPRLSDDRRFSWQVDLRLVIFIFLVLFGILAAIAYNHGVADRAIAGSAAERLQPVTNAPATSGAVRRTVYVPIYSSLYLGRDIKNDMVQLTATLSVRNISTRFPVVIESVRYYDSHGRVVKDHLSQPAELAPLASVEFVVKEADTAGGPGANFLVKWSGPPTVDEPLIEAVMLGRSGNAGISFTSVGRVITNEPQ
jgi:hypothetical protein